MSYIGKLSPTVGGGLGGLPERKSVKVETIPTVDKNYTFSTVPNTYGSTGTSSASLYFDDSNIYTYHTVPSYCAKYSLNRATNLFAQLGMGTGYVTFSGSITGAYNNMPFDIIVSNTLVASASTNNKATRVGSVITFGNIVPISGTTTIDSYTYTNFPHLKTRKCRNSNKYVAVSYSTTTAIIFVLDEFLNILYSKSVALGTTVNGSDALWVNLDRDDNIIISVTNDTGAATIAIVTNKYNLSTLSKIGNTLINLIYITDMTSKSTYVNLVLYDMKLDRIFIYSTETTVSTNNSVLTQIVLIWNSTANSYVSETYFKYPTLSTYRVDNTLNNICIYSSSISRLLGFSWSETSASQKHKYNQYGFPYIDNADTNNNSEHTFKYANTYSDIQENFYIIEPIEQDNYYERTSDATYIYLKGGCSPKINQITNGLVTGVCGINYALNIDNTYYFVVGTSGSGSDTAVCMLKRTEI